VPPDSLADDIFLSRTIDEQLLGQHVLCVNGSSRVVGKVAAVGAAAAQYDYPVQFKRGGSREELKDITVTDTTVTPNFIWVLDERSITATVTRLRLQNRAGTALTRSSIGVHSALFALWGASAALVSREPSITTIAPDGDLYLDGEHAGLEPGMLVTLRTRDGEHAQVVELVDVEVVTGATRLRYKERTPSAHTWTLGDLIVLGNTVPIVHGTTRDEVLGESDGVTPFQRYKLKKAPLGYLAGTNAVSPELEVRVGGVRWLRVDDFGLATAEDVDPTARHYKLERDHDATWILFGDGRTSSVPPAGRSNITARYRVGLGSAGNVDVGRVSRLVKNHPLVEGVSNPVATGGGTEPASSEDVRHQATRFIRTFDRAVSIGDHADLALLFPGVARANARIANGAIELTAATSEGLPLLNRDKLFEFLDARRDTALPLLPVDPVAVPISIHLYFEHDDAFLQRDVEAHIRAALFGESVPGLFTFAARDLGQAAHASEVHAALARVPGVTFVQLLRFDLAGGTELRDVLQPQPHQWLRLDAANLTFAPPSEADLD
jgi:predicted phage baseplate assembly protein